MSLLVSVKVALLNVKLFVVSLLTDVLVKVILLPCISVTYTLLSLEYKSSETL